MHQEPIHDEATAAVDPPKLSQDAQFRRLYELLIAQRRYQHLRHRPYIDPYSADVYGKLPISEIYQSQPEVAYYDPMRDQLAFKSTHSGTVFFYPAGKWFPVMPKAWQLAIREALVLRAFEEKRPDAIRSLGNLAFYYA